MKASHSSHVVVGAGLPGIAASLALAKRGLDVVLLDSAPEIGGLLRSYEVDGFAFDYGTHFANRTGIDELDDLLFGGFESEWIEFPALRAGNRWNGVLNEANDNPDVNTLGRDLHDRCLAELLSAPGWTSDEAPGSARRYLLAEYGPTLVSEFFDPVLKKFTGLASEDLHHQANRLFNLKRFAVLDPSSTDELKRSERFDAKVSFHHRDRFGGHRACLYPRSGGIGTWIGQLAGKLEAAGVEVRSDARIEGIGTEGDRVGHLLVNGDRIGVDHLIWTAAPAAFCKLAGTGFDGPRPQSRATVLAGLVFDRPFLTDCHYVTVFEPLLKSFRATFYPNFRNDGQGRHAATLEFMCGPHEMEGSDWIVTAVDELSEMGTVAEDARLLSGHVKFIPNGFPVQTNESVEGLARQVESIRNFANVDLGGRSSGEGWFLDGLIRGAYEAALKVAEHAACTNR